MAVLLTILTDPRDPTPRRTLALPPNTSILKSAHAASIEITATCGGRGRCTSCRVKFVAGTIPPPTIMDEIQLGNDLVREGYRLSCQCVPSEAGTVQVAPPLEERAFQILGAGPGVVGMGRVTLDSGIRKQVVKVSLPREEHHQISDLEQLAAALGVTPTDVGLAVLQGLPAALRDDPAGVTVTTFAPPGGRGSERVVAVERGDTAGMKFGLAVDIGTTSVVSTLIELDSGEQLASVSSLNPQAVFGGDLMSRIAFAQFASRWTSGPTARSSWARATASGRARRPRARRSRARRSATGCAAPWAPSTVSPWTTTSTCTRSARPTLSGSAARGSSISSPGCSTRA